jgi:2,3-bisphosphoglycerate-independent phosphoglycerate mutase
LKNSANVQQNGAAITAVDLVRGLAKLIGFDLITVPGATAISIPTLPARDRLRLKQ